MTKRISYGVGAHEPIFHRLRTGNANAEEWARWERETSIENLDVLEKLGVTTAHLPCTKGFGFEYEKPLIERAAKFAEAAAKRGIKTDVYVQGFPIYYETFLVETPQAVNWLARDQDGRYIPWGNQTFRRWVDPTCVEFLEYQRKMFTYILSMIRPHHFMMDNTQVAATYTDSSRASWRKYLEDKFTPDEAYREFGIKSFKAIDLPVFDPIYYPIDAFNIVKDPIMQEWTFWRAQITDTFLTSMRDHIKSIAPEVHLISPSGCEGLRYNQFFRAGINYEARIDILDDTHMEESGWRPGIIESKAPQDLNIIMDERSPDAGKEIVREIATAFPNSTFLLEATLGERIPEAKKSSVRISTDSRWGKIMHNYNKHGAVQFFWGETTRETKLKALAHGFCFSQHPSEIGSIGPLCADPRMGDDTRDVFDWGNQHIGILTNREKRFSPVAVWRSTNTNAFIRHRPVWEACVTEQILYENHIPFDIILDNGLERFLEGRKLLILPGASCISQKQIDLITAFVEKGGNLLLLGATGTRDERTRVRTKHAFAHLLGASMPNLEQMGPPHWVPTLDFSKMPESISATFGKGKVSLIKKIEEIAPLNLTRDVYMPERQVFVEDIVPPKNEGLIMAQVYALYGKDSLQIDGPRWALTEYWKQGKDLLICCANLRQRYDGGPITIKLGGFIGNTIELHTLLKSGVENIPVTNGIAIIKSFEHFCAVTVRGYF